MGNLPFLRIIITIIIINTFTIIIVLFINIITIFRSVRLCHQANTDPLSQRGHHKPKSENQTKSSWCGGKIIIPIKAFFTPTFFIHLHLNFVIKVMLFLHFSELLPIKLRKIAQTKTDLDASFLSCSVCEDQAYCKHYGVITCEGFSFIT